MTDGPGGRRGWVAGETRRAPKPSRRVSLTPPRLDIWATPGRGGAAAARVLYQPRHRARIAAGAVARLVPARSRHSFPSPEVQSIVERIAQSIGVEAVAAAALNVRGTNRWLYALTEADNGGAVVKVGDAGDEGLAREASMLTALSARSTGLYVPVLRWHGEHDGWLAIVTEIVARRRATADPGLDDASAAARALATVKDGFVVHGDLTPWNMIPSDAGVALIDWEHGRFAHDPLYDLAHYVIRAGALLHKWRPGEAVRHLIGDDSVGCQYLRETGVDPGSASEHLIRYLRRPTSATSSPIVRRYETEMADILRSNATTLSKVRQSRVARLARQSPGRGLWVLVSEGGNGESRAAVAAVRALSEAGYRTAVTETSRLSLAGASRACARRVTVPSVEGDGAAYAAAVRAELETRPYVTTFHVTDAALLAVDAPVRHLLDKEKCAELARAAGLEPPPTQVFESGAALTNAAAQLRYPVIVKPALKFSAACVVDSPFALERAASEVDGRVLVQPVINEQLHGLGGLAYQGRLVATMHTHYVRVWPQPCGTVAAAETMAPDEELEARVARLLRDYDGPFHLDFAGPYLLDVNPRIHATLPLAVRGGANLVAMYCDLLGGRSVPSVRVEAGLRFRWMEGDLRSLLWNARREASMRSTLAGLIPKRGTVHSFATIRDPGPALARARFMAHRISGGARRVP